MNALNLDRANELFRLDPETGRIYWKAHTGVRSRATIGAEAGCLNSQGYWRIRIGGKNYMAHRIVWLLTHGTWPEGIDHINGNPNDNRPENLREATKAENMENLAIRKDNTSGFTGVRRNAAGNWQALIAKNGKRHCLGSFPTPEQAAAAYAAAKRELHTFQPTLRTA